MPPSSRVAAHDLFEPIEKYPLALQHTPGDEAYWFCWDSSHHGQATIRIAKLGDVVMVFREYREGRFGKIRRYRALLTLGSWLRVEDAIIAANFWMLDEDGGRHGLDGSTWRFAGRRRHDFHHISRWSPDGALWDLGRLFFGLAELGEVRLY